MPWFKVDDKLWSHPKALHLTSTALGVWLRAGSYCADHLTDGHIEARTLHVICPEPRPTLMRAVWELIDAGLWEEAGEGWRFHDWCDHQPTRREVEADRAAGRERQRRSRERRGLAPVTPMSRRDSRVTDA